MADVSYFFKFIPADVLQNAGFKSRKAMKTAIYARAKCLYDLDRGTDKLVLIQSVILMGFWYTDAQDHTGAWYWIGIAISLSQTLGLHRSPQFNNRSQQLPESQQPLTRRIWWSCLVRDRWISLAKGRPMRIHHEDCDLPMPTSDDILNNLGRIPIQTRNEFIPTEAEMLSKMWINLVEISSTLGRILRIHYRVNGPKANAEDIHSSAEDLRYCRPRESHISNASELLRLHAFHVELFYEATVVVLYRPYVLSGPSSQPFEMDASVQKMALDQARAAGSNTNAVLERIIELNMVHLLKPMMITTIIPAMQIHLFDCKSAEPLRRGLGTNKLNLCMLVLSQLRDTYWSASVTHRLFARAQTLLDNHSPIVTAQSKKPTSHPRRMRTQPNSTAIDTEQTFRPLNQQQSPPQYQTSQSQHSQQLQNTEEATGLIPGNNMLTNEQLVPAWMENSPYFTNVDQLLSPGFTLPEDTFQSFYAGYDDGMGVYDQSMPVSAEMPIDLLYRG
ncbi:Cutinase transcription factor 1 beta [Hyphodiscus hymeniophilus]|uniref:Cutinase transcription factor 1 beta n=1 Tax=Hyphodiscus hymeniophilus TaxID=353542 RepID=A0A9P6VQG6_9HELO|nr:Cutinase transcription factor 1 beta [Hyphodiscus hymeniophilus]